MSFSLTVAAKAPLVAYPSLIGVGFIDASDSEISIPIEFVDKRRQLIPQTLVSNWLLQKAKLILTS